MCGVSVTHSSGTHTVAALADAGNFTMSGGTLTVNGNMTIGGNLTLSGGTLVVNGSLAVTGTFTLSGGTLQNATVAAGMLLPPTETVKPDFTDFTI